MLMTHRTGRRLAALSGLCLVLTLGTASHAAAYPVTLEGAPLHLQVAPPTATTAPEGLTEDRRAGAVPGASGTPVSIAESSSSPTVWETVVSVLALASIAALAAAAAFVLIGDRRHAADAR